MALAVVHGLGRSMAHGLAWSAGNFVGHLLGVGSVVLVAGYLLVKALGRLGR